MNLQPENKLNADLTKIFEKLGLDTRFAAVKVSDRADLSDFQCNGALALAKIAHKNPREIAQAIADELKNCPEIEAVSVDGPGFINIKLTNDFIHTRMYIINNNTSYRVIATFSHPEITITIYNSLNRSNKNCF